MGTQPLRLCTKMVVLRLFLPFLLLVLSTFAFSADQRLYTKVYTPEEKKAMGKAIRYLADMDQSFNGRVRPRFGKRSPYEDAQRMLASMDQSFNGQVRPRFGKRGSNDEALRFLADMDQSYNGQVRPRFGKRFNNILPQYDVEED